MAKRDGPQPVHLTGRESEVLRLVSLGRSSKQIAVTLGIAPRTVEAYIEHVRLKLSASNRTHMVALAAAEHLVILDDGEAE